MLSESVSTWTTPDPTRTAQESSNAGASTVTTPPPKKRTLKDKADNTAESSSKAKKARSAAQTSGDNKKRDECQLCRAPRSEEQRGAVCGTCMRSFRKITGHQNVSKCVGDTDLIAKVVAASKAVVEGPPHQGREHQVSRKPVSRRLRDIEDMLRAIMGHLGLQR